jgi:hypothetical protein
MFKAAVTFLAISTVTALDYYGTPELIADTRISSASVIPPNVTYAAPISPLTPGNGTFLVFGTDELNCSTKDASGANVKFVPTRGFIQFNYTLPYRWVPRVRLHDVRAGWDVQQLLCAA